MNTTRLILTLTALSLLLFKLDAAQREPVVLIWLDGFNERIQAAAADGIGGIVTLADISGASFKNPVSLTTDGKKIYWSDTNTDSVYSCNIDGTGQTTIAVSYTYGLTAHADKIYLAKGSDTGGIASIDTDSLAFEQVIPSGTGASKITCDSNKLYWIYGTSIYRSNLDGSAQEVILSESHPASMNMTSLGSNDPTGITTDGSKIYWTDYNGKALYSSNTDGSGAELLVDLHEKRRYQSRCSSLVIVENMIYLAAKDDLRGKFDVLSIDLNDPDKFVNLLYNDVWAEEITALPNSEAGGIFEYVYHIPIVADSMTPQLSINGSNTLEVSTVQNRGYQIESSASLEDDSWITYHDFTGTNSEIDTVTIDVSEEEKMFFRVRTGALLDRN
jgi:hypothetical protein